LATCGGIGIAATRKPDRFISRRVSKGFDHRIGHLWPPANAPSILQWHLSLGRGGLVLEKDCLGWTSGHIQTEKYGFKVFAVPSALLNGFAGHCTVQLDPICDIGSLFHGHTTWPKPNKDTGGEFTKPAVLR
jgi:hypothetical protein